MKDLKWMTMKKAETLVNNLMFAMTFINEIPALVDSRQHAELGKRSEQAKKGISFAVKDVGRGVEGFDEWMEDIARRHNEEATKIMAKNLKMMESVPGIPKDLFGDKEYFG